jgi:uncharacterized membrane protein YfcA
MLNVAPAVTTQSILEKHAADQSTKVKETRPLNSRIDFCLRLPLWTSHQDSLAGPFGVGGGTIVVPALTMEPI